MNNNLLNSFISHTSNILNTANRIIPLYEEIKPILKNIIDIKNKLKSFNINSLFSNNKIAKSKNIIKKEEHLNYSSNPQFFL